MEWPSTASSGYPTEASPSSTAPRWKPWSLRYRANKTASRDSTSKVSNRDFRRLGCQRSRASRRQ